MRISILTLLLVLLLSVSLFAEHKVAILDFEALSREAGYLATQSMRPKFFDPVFEGENNLILINAKDIKKALKGIDLKTCGIEGYAKISEDLGADIIVWGTVAFENPNYKVDLRLFMNQSKKISTHSFSSRKSRNDSQEDFKKNMIPKITDLLASLEQDYQLGLQHYAGQNFTAAKEAFLRALRITPDKVEIYQYIATINYAERNFAEAESYALQGLKIDPNNTGILLLLAQSLRRQGRNEEALEKFQELNENEEKPELYFYIAEIHKENYDNNESVEALNSALELNPDYNTAREMLVDILYEEEEFEDAIPHLEFLSDKFPENESFQRRLTTAYLRTKRLDLAITNYKQQIEKEPKNETLYLRLAKSYRMNSNVPETIATLLKLIEINPEQIEAINLLADSYLAAKDYKNSEKYAKMSIAKKPEFFDPYMILSRISQIKGYAKYEEYLKKDEEGANLYGEEKNKNIDERDQIKAEAYNLFVESEKYLLDAEKRIGNNPSLEIEIKNEKQKISALKKQTEKTFFE
ncbi:MAG: tetratricopeptide repeat protein [Candidatus Cloacimonetes bacterium]|nr:tetratricopeptide repeat protein [Candidatus Cloacimonadota bacterium]